jgi:hypothetical protein
VDRIRPALWIQQRGRAAIAGAWPRCQVPLALLQLRNRARRAPSPAGRNLVPASLQYQHPSVPLHLPIIDGTLDPKVVVLNGVAYHQNETGTHQLLGHERSPFMTVTWFGEGVLSTARPGPGVGWHMDLARGKGQHVLRYTMLALQASWASRRGASREELWAHVTGASHFFSLGVPPRPLHTSRPPCRAADRAYATSAQLAAADSFDTLQAQLLDAWGSRNCVFAVRITGEPLAKQDANVAPSP